MHAAIAFFFTTTVLIVVLFAIGTDMLDTFGDVTDAWHVIEARTEERSDTKITGPLALSVSATSTVQMTIVNEGRVALGGFADWDVIFEVQTAPGLGISYLSYATSSSPAAGEWTAKGIYLDAASSAPEIVDPGVLNPGEEMVVLANPSPSVKANTYDRAIFSTPNGVALKTIFHVVP